MKTNTNKGWIKLYRSIWDQEQSADPYWVAVWMYLLTHAAHEETEVTFKGEKIKLKPGQLVVTIRSFTNAMPSLKRDRVHRILCGMTEDCLIGKRSDKRFTFITVREWASYQGAVGQLSETEQEEKKKKVKVNGLVADNPPSVEEVCEYIDEKGYKINGEYFHDFYTSCDWVRGANGDKPMPMKCWKNVVVTWNNNNKNGSPKPIKEDRLDYSKVMKGVKNAAS